MSEKKTINVALCVSGEMRRWYNLHNTVLNLMFPYSKKYAQKNGIEEYANVHYNLDVFIHTWDQITYSKRQKTWDLNIRETGLDHAELIEKIKPKKILIEDILKINYQHVLQNYKNYILVKKK